MSIGLNRTMLCKLFGNAFNGIFSIPYVQQWPLTWQQTLLGLGMVMLVSTALCGLVLAMLHRFKIMDVPNERSQHSVPTPRGGGWGILLTALPLWLFFSDCLPIRGMQVTVICVLVLVLAVVAWLDDLKEVSASIRLFIQAAIALIIIGLVPYETILVTDYWPRWLEHGLLFFGVIWMINLHNFMDGADGLLATQVITVLVGLAGMLYLADARIDLIARVLILAAATGGFLVWNFPRAKLFAGDIGSMALGLLITVLIIESTEYLHIATIMILPLYFVMDATVTLVRRVAAGHHPFTPHREHFFQKILQAGWSTRHLLAAVFLLNAILCMIAIGWRSQPWWALLLLAIPLVSIVLWLWHRRYVKSIAVNSLA